MRLTGREDIALGISDAYGLITDFDYLERQVLRRGIDVVRTDKLGRAGPGATWTAKPRWRGRDFPLVVELSDLTEPESVALLAESGGLAGNLSAELVALSRNSTRLRAILTVKGNTFRDRMFVQSVKLGKSALDRRFAQVLHDFARAMESRFEQA